MRHSEFTLSRKVATGLMLFLGAAALVAFVSAALEMRNTGVQIQVVEMWRTLGFLVFAGLFVLLGVYPRRLPGLWELVFLHKAGMAIFAALNTGAAGASLSLIVDTVLAVVILTCYLLSRGYMNWADRRSSENPISSS